MAWLRESSPEGPSELPPAQLVGHPLARDWMEPGESDDCYGSTRWRRQRAARQEWCAEHSIRYRAFDPMWGDRAVVDRIRANTRSGYVQH